MSINLNIQNIVGNAATKISEDIGANGIITIERAVTDLYNEESPFYEVKVSIFKKLAGKTTRYIKSDYKKKIKRPEPGHIVSMKELLMDAVANKYILKGERVVCIQDESMGAGYKSMMFIFDVDKIFFDISHHKLAENIQPDVLESVIEVALEIAKEGREGKKIGTAFIIGDREVLNYTRQMIINPFASVDESARLITDPILKETVKEFAQLDGVFIIDENGVIMTSGAYISVDSSDLHLPHGLGTKHRNCAALTAKTNAIAVVVSESGGKVRIFKNGKIAITL